MGQFLAVLGEFGPFGRVVVDVTDALGERAIWCALSAGSACGRRNLYQRNPLPGS